MPSSDKSGLSYADAGVDISAGDALVERIKPAAKSTHRPGVMGGLGGFGGLFDLAATGYDDPVLVSATDGVGTKLMLAFELNKHATIGIDLVAMCVNDIVVQGAEPLFFLDYFATGKLSPEAASEVIAGIATGCQQAGAALLGGETAEMPGMYPEGHYDLAGFCVGVAERDGLIDGSTIGAGDVVLGLASDGIHSNGYSLVRKIVERTQSNLDDDSLGAPLGEILLRPTRIYVSALINTLGEFPRRKSPIKGLAHITGGGLSENIPRILPVGAEAVIDLDSWTLPSVFEWLRAGGSVSDSEMLRTFNCGLGMIVIVDANHADHVVNHLRSAGETVFVVGEISRGDQKVSYKGDL